MLLALYSGRMNSFGGIQHMNLDEVSPATRLLEKRRQMFEVQEALETQKEEFARREELFKRREEALRKQDLELQQQLIRFNKFLQVPPSLREHRMRSKHLALMDPRLVLSTLTLVASAARRIDIDPQPL